MEHGPVSRIAAPEVVTPDDAGKSAPLAHADHVDFVVGLELVGQNAIACLQITDRSRFEAKLALEFDALGAGLLQMPGLGLRNAGLAGVLHQSELHGIVAV